MPFSLTRPCSACRAQNRTPASRLAQTGRCGACKAALGPVSAPLDVKDAASFDTIISSVPVPVLVDFWAAWCGPCRVAAPEVASLAKEMAGLAVVLKVNTEEVPALAARYDVQSIPNFVVFSQGRMVHQQAGFSGRRTLQQLIAGAGLSGPPKGG